MKKNNNNVLIEYFSKATVADPFVPIVNLNADAHTPANLTKSKVWDGYLVVNGINYSSGFHQASYSDIVPRGLVRSYLDFNASYINIVWTDHVEYKVRVTVKRGGETVIMEQVIPAP